VPDLTVDAYQPASALAVFAHPDDPEVSCAGTLALWADGGAAVHLVIVNRGEKGSRGRVVDPDELASTRADEVRAAAAVLGLTGVTLFGLPDGESENDLRLRARLVEVVRAVQPEAVVCPDPTALYFGDHYVNHRDHRVVGYAVLDAVAPAAASPLYFPDAGPPHQVGRVYLSGTLEPDTAIDIGATVERKAEALACHRTQLGDDPAWVGELVAQRAADAGRTAGLAAAEAFRLLRLTRP
jgi:LmbE family N-acetylglucosaminyl deacetylase